MIDTRKLDTDSSVASNIDTLHELESPDDAAVKCFPDGGAQAWLCVFGAFLALFYSFGQLNAWDVPVVLWVFFFSGGFIGRVFDAHGPRVIMIPGTVILVFSTMMMSLCKQYYQFVLAQGISFGLGVGMFLDAFSQVARDCRRAGSGVGGVVYPIVLRRLFVEVGFAWAVRISTFICLALCIVAVGTVMSRSSVAQRSGPWFNANVVFISLGLFIPFFYIVDYAIAYSIAPSTAFYVLSVMNAGGTFGRLAPPWLSDGLGRFNMLVPCAYLAGLSTLVLWVFARGLVALMLFAAVYGFSGAFNALIVPCVAQILDIRENRARFGLLYSIISFPSLCGGPAAGALLWLHGGSYTGVTMFSGATIAAGSLCMLWTRIWIDPRIFARV